MNNARKIDGLGRITIPHALMNRLHLRADDQIAVSLSASRPSASGSLLAQSSGPHRLLCFPERRPVHERNAHHRKSNPV